MGLSAGQARLLTITARKSDCEFSSMRLSHQKIALARELADLSNEYQNSLTRTKLAYDYYGTGDITTPLTYGLMMNPSALNDFMPITLTDSMGRVTLNNKYAAAARAAGIPQEGLGTLPSEDTRNKFIQGLFQSGLVNNAMASTIIGLPYNQQAGLGGGITVACQTRAGNVDDLIAMLSKNGESLYLDVSSYKNSMADCKNENKYDNGIKIVTANELKDSSLTQKDFGTNTQINLAQLLSNKDEDQFYLSYSGFSGEQSPVFGIALMQSLLCNEYGNSVLDWMADEFAAVLDTGDAFTQSALDYAYKMTSDLLIKDDDSFYNSGKYYTGYEYYSTILPSLLAGDKCGDMDEATQYDTSKSVIDDYYTTDEYLKPIGTDWSGKSNADEDFQKELVKDSKYYMGFLFVGSAKGGGDNGDDHATGAINLNNIAKAFLTYFTKYMDGLASIGADGKEAYYVQIGSTNNAAKNYYNKKQPSVNRLATEDNSFIYDIKIGQSVSSDALQQATFYDALFNQICLNGWTENNNVNDKEYLQQMLQSGMMLVSRVVDDGFYYQGNYATDSYIKEVTDESFIAQAEAKYSTEKAKLNAKEETLDLKMKNLDTEISSLSTEYDTVKNTISKNIEKTFKRYNA